MTFMGIDLNFYPEDHLDILKDLTDIEVPKGWTLGKLVEELDKAGCMLWEALNYVDRDGCIRPRWK